MESENYYKTLGVDKKASAADIKKAYRKLSKEYHPDKNPDGEDQFKKISEAYSILSDPTKRLRYDQTGSTKAGPTIQDVHDAFKSQFRNMAFSMMDLEHLNIHIDKHYKISELMNGVEGSVEYQVSKSSLENSEIKTNKVDYKVNLSQQGYPLAVIGDKLGIIVRVRHAGSSQEIDGFDDVFHRRQHGTATGDLFIRIIIDFEGVEINDRSDIIQTIDLSLYDVLFSEEIVLSNPMGKKYKIKSIKSPAMSNIQVRIPEQGLVSAFGKRGSYIFKINVIRPDFSKISEDKLTTLKELLRDLDK